MKINNTYWVEDGFLYWGRIPENQQHQHYALQMTVSLEQTFLLQTQGQELSTTACFIPSQLSHSLLGTPSVMLLLILPTSRLGQYCQQTFSSTSAQTLSPKIKSGLLQLGKEFWDKEATGIEEVKLAYQQWRQKILPPDYSSPKMDKRIQKFLHWLSKRGEGPIPATIAAQQVQLSTSRFLHLFRKETGITYRRMQLWMKLVQAYKELEQVKNLTELAHAVGFSDSAHLSRTFKETFGLPPSLLV